MKKVVLVIGGAGFIGSHLCSRLIEAECYEVISLDNYSGGSEQNHVAGVRYVYGASRDILKLINFKPDIIFHFGEYSRVENSFDSIDKVIESNIIGTANVLEFVRMHGCKIVYSGSSTKFDYSKDGINSSPYAWSKAKNTELVKNYGAWFGINYVITYFYNVYGEREVNAGEYATLIGLFIEKMRQGKPLTVVSPGHQKRNFTSVHDIVDALILIGESGSGDGYGIGHSDAYTIIEVAKLFGGEVVMLPERKGNRLSAALKTSKTEALGWKCKYDLPSYINKLRLNNWIARQ